MDHVDDLVAHLAKGPEIIALVPVVGGNADKEGLAGGKRGPQFGHEGDKVGL